MSDPTSQPRSGAPTSAQARARAAKIVAQVADHGRSLDGLLAMADDGARGLTRSLVYGTLRWHIRLAAVLAELSARPVGALDGELRALLLVGLYQLLHTDIAVHAAVAETVEAATALKQKRAAGFVNAILRRCQREGAAIAGKVDLDPAVRTAHPPWLLRQLQTDWGERSEAVLAANNAHPPFWLRINRRRTARDAYVERLRLAGLQVELHAAVPEALLLLEATDVRKLPGFDAGEVSVQDAAAQCAAHLLDAKPGDRVLDACAAPGGKACHILELQPELAELVAVDVSGSRLRRVAENLARLQLHATLVEGDAAKPKDWWDGRPFERILLDAPCSATGVIRRHPDIKLLRRPEDIDALAARQGSLLDALWPLLAKGGRLLYATCSALRAENADVVAAFLRRHPEAKSTAAAASGLEPGLEVARLGAHLGSAPGLAIAAGEAQMDGFYYACLDKGP